MSIKHQAFFSSHTKNSRNFPIQAEQQRIHNYNNDDVRRTSGAYVRTNTYSEGALSSPLRAKSNKINELLVAAFVFFTKAKITRKISFEKEKYFRALQAFQRSRVDVNLTSIPVTL